MKRFEYTPELAARMMPMSGAIFGSGAPAKIGFSHGTVSKKSEIVHKGLRVEWRGLADIEDGYYEIDPNATVTG